MIQLVSKGIIIIWDPDDKKGVNREIIAKGFLIFHDSIRITLPPSLQFFNQHEECSEFDECVFILYINKFYAAKKKSEILSLDLFALYSQLVFTKDN